MRRQRDRAGDQFAGLPQRDVHRPVLAAEFGELAGAVERVDDPHPLGGQPHRVVGALLGQHRVAGPSSGQRLHQKVVGALVPRSLSLGGGGVGEFVAHAEQQFARLGRQRGGDLVVGSLVLSPVTAGVDHVDDLLGQFVHRLLRRQPQIRDSSAADTGCRFR